MFKGLKRNAILSVVLFALAFIFYLSFCITFKANYGKNPEIWFILVFILIFGLGYVLGVLLPKFAGLAKGCLLVLLVGNIAISLTMDPEQLFALSDQNPAWGNAAHVFAGLGGLAAVVALIVLTLGYAFPLLGILKKIGKIALLVTAVLYLGATICYFFAGETYWLFLGILTATAVYVAFFFAIPAMEGGSSEAQAPIEAKKDADSSTDQGSRTPSAH
jgi:hypothetical protein